MSRMRSSKAKEACIVTDSKIRDRIRLAEDEFAARFLLFAISREPKSEERALRA